jgi:sugar (pentulose or hexulose) kinase
MRSLLFSSISTLKIGMDILTEKENVKLSKIHGHGGMFKTPVVGQKIMAGVLNIPVAVMDSAGEGGAWGIAILAAYAGSKTDGQTLENFLENRIFKSSSVTVINPDPVDVEGFKSYFVRYKAALQVERTAVEVLENIGE